MDELADELVVAPDIREPSQLKGRRVGVGRFGAAADILMRTALVRLGLDPEPDVTIFQVGDEALRLAALTSGSVAATIIEAPQTALANQRVFVLWFA